MNILSNRNTQKIFFTSVSNIKGFCYINAIILLNFFFVSLGFSAEPTPILNSISMDQQKLYMESLPRGQDNIPINPSVIQPLAIQDTLKMQPSGIEKNIAEKLTTISLEEKIQQQAIQPTLEQFGYDLFRNTPTTYAPVTNIPVPSDYIIGPGDTIIAQLYGKTNVEYKLVVTREGNILVPDIGPVLVSGLSFSEVKDNLNDRFSKHIFGTKSAITMGNLRTINIMIVGDVNNPGSYTVAGLTDMMNALLTSGGIKRTGSLRNIQLKRNGKVVTTFDLYDVLLYGNTSSNVKISHGDIIFVPPIGPTVAVGGEVQRPAIYELKNNFTLSNIIRLAGGLLPTASLEASHIERIKDGQYHTLISLAGSGANSKNIKIKAGDLIRIFPVKKLIDDVVLLSGHVIQPGGYELKKNMRLSQLLRSSSQLLQNADMEKALLRRENRKKKSLEVKYINLKNIFDKPGSKDDLFLQPRDEIIIFNLSENRSKRLQTIVRDIKIQSTVSHAPMIFNINGHIRNHGTFPLQYASRLLDIIDIAGGIEPGTDLDYILIARKKFPSSELEMFSIDIKKAQRFPDSEWNTIIHPEDSIYLFDSTSKRTAMIKHHIEQLKRQTQYGQMSPVVSIGGEVNHTGKYPLEPGMKLSKLIQAAGGLNEMSFGIGAELTRYKIIDGQYQIAEHKYIDLTKAINGDKNANIILHPHDHLTIHKKPQWHNNKMFVELSGEVHFPGKYPINNNETLCNVIQRAGGLTDNAYPFASVFTRDSVRIKQQASLDKVQDELDDILVKLHLSPSLKNDEKMPENEEINEINNIIKKLKKAKASGRMVIDMENILACNEEADILLENGDKLVVPSLAYEVSVMGEVFYPSTHNYARNKGSQDYINLSGGVTDLAKNKYAYVVQANGEVNSVRKPGWFSSFNNIELKPGATIYVPIDIDRSNPTETLQAWTQVVFRLTLSAAGIAAIL